MYGLATTGLSLLVYGSLAAIAVVGGVVLKIRGGGRRRS